MMKSCTLFFLLCIVNHGLLVSSKPRDAEDKIHTASDASLHGKIQDDKAFEHTGSELADTPGCWTKTPNTYVKGSNIEKLKSKSLEECKQMCLRRSSCVAIEYYHNYGGKYKSYWQMGYCWLNSRRKPAKSPGKDYNTDVYVYTCGCWTKTPNTYVRGSNIKKLKSKSLEECKQMCLRHSSCVAIEYYHNYGGKYKSYWQKGYCWLNSRTKTAKSPGKDYNTDVYVYESTCNKVQPLKIKYSGAWNFYFGGVSFILQISNGEITIEGKPITLTSSDNVKYPNSAGWMKFNRDSILYYIKFGPTMFEVVAFKNGEKIAGTVIKQMPSYITNVISRVTGSWNFNFPSGIPSFKFGASNGKIVIDGQPVTLVTSNSLKYPTSQGWLMFTFRGVTYYVHISDSGVKVVASSGGLFLIGGVTTVQVPQVQEEKTFHFDIVDGGTCTSVTKEVCKLIAQSKWLPLMTGIPTNPAGCFTMNNQYYFNDNLDSMSQFGGGVRGFCVKGSAKAHVTISGHDQPSKHQHE